MTAEAAGMFISPQRKKLFRSLNQPQSRTSSGGGGGLSSCWRDHLSRLDLPGSGLFDRLRLGYVTLDLYKILLCSLFYFYGSLKFLCHPHKALTNSLFSRKMACHLPKLFHPKIYIFRLFLNPETKCYSVQRKSAQVSMSWQLVNKRLPTDLPSVLPAAAPPPPWTTAGGGRGSKTSSAVTLRYLSI